MKPENNVVGATVRRIVGEAFGVPVGKVQPDTHLRDLHRLSHNGHGWALLSLDIEEAFGIELPDEVHAKVQRPAMTVKGIVTLIHKMERQA